jgi:hypothetical protein
VELAASATLDCRAVVDAVGDADDDDSCLVLAWHEA